MRDAASSSRAGKRSRAHPWWIGLSVLVLIGATCLTLGLETNRHPLAGPAGSAGHDPPALTPRSATPPSTAPHAVAPTIPPIPVVAHSVPVSLQIPAIEVSVSLSSL